MSDTELPWTCPTCAFKWTLTLTLGVLRPGEREKSALAQCLKCGHNDLLSSPPDVQIIGVKARPLTLG